MIKYFSLLTLLLLPSLSFGMEKNETSKKTAATISIIQQLKEQQAKGGSTVEDIICLKDQFATLDQKYKKIKIKHAGLKRTISQLDPDFLQDSPKRTKLNKEEQPLTPVKSLALTYCQKPELVCSPMKPQNNKESGLIYMIYGTGNNKASLIEKGNRINASRLEVGPMTKENLNKALLEIEVKLLQLIDRSMISRVVYVGLTKRNIETRIREHANDLKHPIKKYSSNKVRQINGFLKEHLNVKASYIVKKVPIEFLDIVEALVSYVFLVQEFGGSAKIATSEAWGHFDTYFKSILRKQTLTEKKLDKKLFEIAHELLNLKLGINFEN